MTRKYRGRTKRFYTDGKGRRRPIAGRSLYRNGAQNWERKKFEREYGMQRGDYVYGATVGKVKRESEVRAMTAADLERKAEHMAYNGKPVKLIAMKRRSDGLFDTYTQSFDNWNAANRAAITLKNEGYDVAMATLTVREGA